MGAPIATSSPAPTRCNTTTMAACNTIETVALWAAANALTPAQFCGSMLSSTSSPR
ncbi:hypothetical protein MYSE111917_27480 [Mycobacterium senriense]